MTLDADAIYQRILALKLEIVTHKATEDIGH
jgi:hypothetical protein